MPRGPQGQKRPADVIGNAVHIAQIATGEAQETTLAQPAKRKIGFAGAKARVENTTSEDRKAIAQKAAAARWGLWQIITQSVLQTQSFNQPSAKAFQ
jgi:hypothetical protein